jgi:hypothetical protein
MIRCVPWKAGHFRDQLSDCQIIEKSSATACHHHTHRRDNLKCHKTSGNCLHVAWFRFVLKGLMLHFSSSSDSEKCSVLLETCSLIRPASGRETGSSISNEQLQQRASSVWHTERPAVPTLLYRQHTEQESNGQLPRAHHNCLDATYCQRSVYFRQAAVVGLKAFQLQCLLATDK